MIVYEARGNMTEPRPVECEKPGYPNVDVDGNTMYENTHFINEDDAWDQLKGEREAHVSNAAGNVEYAEMELQKAKENLVNASLLLTKFWDAHNRREVK
jgi:hypothetical protein